VTEPAAELSTNRYGKSAIRLVKIIRGADRHAIRDLTVAIALEGDFASSYVDGNNSLVVATDTMKNTVYALAREYLTGPVEAFGAVLARHFVAIPQVERATVSIEEHAWRPIGEAPDAFSRDRSSTRTAVVAATREGETVDAGIADLTVMKTGKSAFAGFPRDEFTTLPDTDDRIMATKLSATWRYDRETDYDRSFEAVRSTLLEVFADHDSPSVQTSIWIMARAMLERHQELIEVRMVLPNLHHWLADLSPFGMTNDQQVYVATTEPHGLIEATVRRGDVDGGGER
jgi:urate oxidase